ncbi:MAG: response regulator [Syntrophomonadaceae bacterium]|nr:response regulator [Syntrophomonadaceae bacterium]
MANILIADDSTVMRRSLRLILTKGGHTVAGQATDGASACLMYNQLKPDLVTMDITMPGINGIEAMLKILESDPSAKIIMITAIDQKRMIFEAIKSGARHYIIKPFEDDKVLSTINEVLRQD